MSGTWPTDLPRGTERIESRRWMVVRVIVPLLLALVWPTLVRAQSEAVQSEPSTDGLNFPARARAVLPAGQAVGRSEWNGLRLRVEGGPGGDPRFPSGLDVIAAEMWTYERELRVPIDSLVLELFATVRTVEGWGWRFVATGNVEVGAAFRDAPASGWRYELGARVALPVRTLHVLEGVPGTPGVLFPEPRPPRVPWFGGYGWNVHRTLGDTGAFTPRARLEVDPVPWLVVALEGDLVLTLDFDGEVRVYPQGSLEVAWRFVEFGLLGVRGELTSYRDVNVLIEPFLRLVVPVSRRLGVLLRVAGRFPLGPAWPAVSSESVGFVGASFDLGLVF